MQFLAISVASARLPWPSSLPKLSRCMATTTITTTDFFTTAHAMAAEPTNDSGPASDVPTPNPKPKKRVLSDEQEQREHQERTQPVPAILEPSPPAAATPRTPRPALRRNTSYDAPEEREKADWAEQRTSKRQLHALDDARQRANRLALSVGSASAPGSRRNSDELEASFQQPLIGNAGDHTRSPADDGIMASQDQLDYLDHLHRRTPYSHRRGRVVDDQTTAETLVRSHTRRDRSRDLFHREPASSGTSTPVLTQAYTQDYVPRPEKYRGGILSSLLRLYHDHDRGAGSNNSSGYTTPVSFEAPFHSWGHPLTDQQWLVQQPQGTPLNDVPDRAHQVVFHAEEGEASQAQKEQIRVTVHIAGIISRHRYLLKLCRALMLYGAPTHRLEEYMTMSSRVLEIEGQFLYMPSCMIISFDDSTTHTTEVKVIREPQGIDLGKLRDVHNIYKEVVHDKLGVEEATERLDEVMKRRPKFRTWFRVPMYGIASACVAPFAFEGRFIDLPIAFLLGCIVGLLQLVFAPSNELYAHVFEVSAAVITSFLARGFGSINNGQLFCFSTLAQSSIALILPGYMVLCSSLELQSHNIVSGSVRMVYAMIYTATHCQNPLNRGWYFLFVPGFTLCLCIINQAKWKQTPIMTFMALAGFCVNSYCSTYFEGNSQISNMLGALTIGILANLYSRLGRHAENLWLDFVEWWEYKMRPRFTRRKRPTADTWSLPSMSDVESRPGSPEKPHRHQRKVGYSLAAAAMLPAIFVQVPSGLAAGGSLLAGITSADQITRNGTQGGNSTVDTSAKTMGSLDGTAFNVLFSVIQVAIGISVGLFMSALIVYPLGKRRSGLFSF
ncbi:hypothetical protein ACCO45_012035 [Purpureocillium lilacinum]|uniref:Uncharacterized protein n=1 Tax=Purpureocillium lilacinum TaxID=33203 RepID=A0ACC4DCQ4_PURLI